MNSRTLQTLQKLLWCRRTGSRVDRPAVGQTDGHVTTNFFGWIDNQIFLAMNMARNPNLQAWVVQTLDSAIHRINYYQAGKYWQNQYCAIR